MSDTQCQNDQQTCNRTRNDEPTGQPSQTAAELSTIFCQWGLTPTNSEGIASEVIDKGGIEAHLRRREVEVPRDDGLDACLYGSFHLS